jgi:hypothetical protein
MQYIASMKEERDQMVERGESQMDTLLQAAYRQEIE